MRELNIHEIEFIQGAAGQRSEPVVLATPGGAFTGPGGAQRGRVPGLEPDPMPAPAPSEF